MLTIVTKALGETHREVAKPVENGQLLCAQALRHQKSRSFRYLVGQKNDARMSETLVAMKDWFIYDSSVYTALDNWRDLIYQNIAHDSNLQYDLVRILVEDRVVAFDVEEAAYWAKRLQLEPTRLPWDVKV
jgi:hypothetical protein